MLVIIYKYEEKDYLYYTKINRQKCKQQQYPFLFSKIFLKPWLKVLVIKLNIPLLTSEYTWRSFALDKKMFFYCCYCLPQVLNCISSPPWSSLPVCDLTVHLAVLVLKQGPWRSAGGHSGFHSSCFAAVWDSLGPFFLLPCSRIFLGTHLHSNLNLTGLRPDPRCSQTQRSHWAEDSPEHA